MSVCVNCGKKLSLLTECYDLPEIKGPLCSKCTDVLCSEIRAKKQKERAERKIEKEEREKQKDLERQKIVYHIVGVRGRVLDVYEDKIVITTNVGIASFLTGNVTDGEKTIYYADCVGVQIKKTGFLIGYLQVETASGLMNNKWDNFYNENSFTFQNGVNDVTDELMEDVATYIKKRVEETKIRKNEPTTVLSPADELKKFKELLDMGILTQEEFDAKKKQLLGL